MLNQSPSIPNQNSRSKDSRIPGSTANQEISNGSVFFPGSTCYEGNSIRSTLLFTTWIIFKLSISPFHPLSHAEWQTSLRLISNSRKVPSVLSLAASSRSAWLTRELEVEPCRIDQFHNGKSWAGNLSRVKEVGRLWECCPSDTTWSKDRNEDCDLQPFVDQTNKLKCCCDMYQSPRGQHQVWQNKHVSHFKY